MWFTILPVAALAAAVSAIPCEEARLKCPYREGCATALQNYFVGCSAVLQGPGVKYCPQVCEYSLIALVSTDAGNALMECECSDSYCEDQKQRTEVCRPKVMKAIKDPVVPCQIAQLICNADAQCSMAYEYYQNYCKSMFMGKKCTPRCHNSINILRRQAKAQKLAMCKCESDDFECRKVQDRMDRLCFHKKYHKNSTVPRVQIHLDQNPQVIVTSSANYVGAYLYSALWASFLCLWTFCR